ncbi:Protoporphyrinogen oxidase [Termitomyces sp. T112]|nr:Protoporphyrinogen oxidase [Termitomyces sp. T112]
MPPRHIAVLGGGLTGLSSAFHLSRRFPFARITLLEKQNRPGGWVRSEQVQLGTNEDTTTSLTVEAGPRTLRPNSKAVLELVNLLDLKSELLTTPRSSPAARNRFLYLPDVQSGLTDIPTSMFGFLRSPIRGLLLSAIFTEPLRSPNRVPTQYVNVDGSKRIYQDESLDNFLSRRFGPEVARVLGSALCHGVYAADSRRLSVRAAFPVLYNLEEKGNGRVVFGILKDILGVGAGKKSRHAEGGQMYDLGDVEQLMQGVSVYSFCGGVQTLTDALAKALAATSNVELCYGQDVKEIEMYEDENSSLAIHTTVQTLKPTHVVSSIPLPLLNAILPPSGSYARPLPHLTANPSSSVTVLSLVFAVPSNTVHPAGFGYLIPRPRGGYPPPTDVPTRPGILGTVFDSCALPFKSNSESEYTKLTVMLGGPYPSPLPETDYELITRVLAHLAESLLQPLPDPIATRVWRHVDCIPTPGVGHLERMKELKNVLEEESGRGAWRGRLEVVGAGVGGVSVGDCVEAGRRVGARWQ